MWGLFYKVMSGYILLLKEMILDWQYLGLKKKNNRKKSKQTKKIPKQNKEKPFNRLIYFHLYYTVEIKGNIIL